MRVIPQWVFDNLVDDVDLYTIPSRQKIHLRCEKHGVYECLLQNLVYLTTGETRGFGCPGCRLESTMTSKSRAKQSSSRRANRHVVYPEWFISEVYSEDLPSLESKTTHDKIRFVCEKGHVYEQRIGDHVRISTGERVKGCPKCCRDDSTGRFRGKWEDNICALISEPVSKNSLGYIKSPGGDWMELDIVIPSLNRAIECDGESYHDEVDMTYEEWVVQPKQWKMHHKFRGYHQWKTDRCREIGIELLHISYNEWVENPESVEGQVLEFISS